MKSSLECSDEEAVADSDRGCDVTLSDVKTEELVESCRDVEDWVLVTVLSVVMTGQNRRHFEFLLITFSKEFLKTERKMFVSFFYCCFLFLLHCLIVIIRSRYYSVVNLVPRKKEKTLGTRLIQLHVPLS